VQAWRGDPAVVGMQQKISVVLSATELGRFNSYCTDRGYKKSTLIRRLIREHLEREKYPAADDHDATSVLNHRHATAQRRGRSRKQGG